jgi:cytidylate kinase
MQIITISCGSQSYGQEFAKNLAAKLDYLCIGREELLEEATKQKIPIGKLETAIIKPHIFSEELALELEHFKALATSILCEKALNNDIIYYGRTGHLLLPGIDHILKIRVITDMESRIDLVMQKLALSRDKAKQYIDQLDQDRKKWVKQFYNVEWDTSSFYDMVINLSHLNVENAATAVCAMAQLPDFRITPAITNSLKDLYLASKVRLLLAMDTRTSHINLKIRVSDCCVHVSYFSQRVKAAEMISEVLTQVKDAKEIICTEAETNILWIQEAFDPKDDSYNEVLGLAGTWDAAVELLQITPSDTLEQITQTQEKKERGAETWRDTGIMEDKEDADTEDSKGISKIYEKLINNGRAGGKRIIYGSQKTLLNAIDRTIPYRLIILDNIFASKGHAAQTRLLREWSNFIGDNLKIPVLSLDEIRSKYKFGQKEFIHMVFFALITALVVLTIFIFDEEIISFLSREGLGWKIMAAICVFAFIPFFAQLYSTVIKLFLKMLKFD